MVKPMSRPQLTQGCCCRDRETLEPVGHVCECLPPILHMLTTLAQHRPAALTPGYKCHVMLDVALLKLFKVTNTVVEVHPWAVQASGTLLGCLQTYVLIITSARKGGAAWQRITARAMKFVSLVIQNASYNGKQQLVSLKSRAVRGPCSMPLLVSTEGCSFARKMSSCTPDGSASRHAR